MLYDGKVILLKHGEHAQSARRAKFSSVQEIAEMEQTLKAYIYEAIEVEKAGLKIKLKTMADFDIPEEF